MNSDAMVRESADLLPRDHPEDDDRHQHVERGHDEDGQDDGARDGPVGSLISSPMLQTWL